MVFKYPYTDMYALNLDWMLQAIKEVQEIIEALGSVVHTFNNREGNVELLPADVNGLNINILHRLGPGVAFSSLSQAQLKTLYDSGVRIVVAQNQQGIFYRQYLLLNVGGTITGTEFLPVPGETQVLSFNERTGDVELLAADVNNLHINFVYPILDAMSGHTSDFKTWYNAGIRFVQEKVSGVENWYYLTSSGDGDEQTVTATIYDPLKGRGLVKQVNSKSPVSGGNVYVYGTDIDMANDDDTSVETAIKTNSDHIGTLTNLLTDHKTDLVQSINEVIGETVDLTEFDGSSYQTILDAIHALIDSHSNDSKMHAAVVYKGTKILVLYQKYTTNDFASYIAFNYSFTVMYEAKTYGVWNGAQYLNNNGVIAYLETSETATRNYIKNQYLILNNKLYKTKSNISSGDTISNVNVDEINTGGLNDVNKTIEETIGYYCNIRRSGNTVTMNGYFNNLDFSSQTSATLGTITNTNLIPAEVVRCLCGLAPVAYDPPTVIGYLYVNTNGEISVVISGTSSTIHTAYMSASWTVK